MGYTHYFYRREELNAEKFIAASADCRKVCETLDIPLSGSDEDCPVFDADQIVLNGVAGECCEPFLIERVFQERFKTTDYEGRLFSFTKTARYPYDLAVTCCLIVLKHYLGEEIDVKSDGNSDEWQPARDACQNVLGYGADFKLKEDYAGNT